MEQELRARLVVDIECYFNFFLVLFKNIETGELHRIQLSPNRQLDLSTLFRLMNFNITIGFNSLNYDLPMIQLALRGLGTGDLKGASDDIIRGVRYADFAKKYGIVRQPWSHIDLIAVAPGKAGLKLYSGRLHCRKLQDLPISPDTILNAEQAAAVASYCENDLDNTISLYRELEDQVKLREELGKIYKQDLRSKSDPQVAETIICSEIAKIKGSIPRRPSSVPTLFRYKMPEWIKYETPQLQHLKEVVLNTDFSVNDSGHIDMPESLSGLSVRLAGSTYRVGIGGLHSSEVHTSHFADEGTMLIDLDVASYYPSIILNQGLTPSHIGETFLTVYRDLVSRRLAAKKAKDKVTAESLKVAVNGIFGKLGNKWSSIYAPDLMIQITIGGQLALLMLIEKIELAGISVVSANTDGILVKCPSVGYDVLKEVVDDWQKITGFVLEEARYSAVYSKDVNNYIAVKLDGTIKNKGLYSNPWEPKGKNIFKLQKNPNTTIVIEAVIDFLVKKVPLIDTITACKDITKFVSVRTVAGGATQNGNYLGKVVRWYYSKDGKRSTINYQKSTYKVPKTDSSKQLMELPEKFPTDIHYEWYVQEALEVLNNLGYRQGSLMFD